MKALRVAVLAVLLGAALAAGFMSTPLRVSAVAPDKYGWWNFAYQTSAQPISLTTNPDDVFVEGRQGNTALTPTAPPPPFPSGVGDKGAAQAIGALSFTIPPGETVESVTLLFASGSESANCQYDPSSSNPLGSSCVNVMACRTTGPFKAELNGPWQDVPPYDCTIPSMGALSPDTKGLTFTDIGTLAQGSTLSFVLVPGFYDYEDFLKPGKNALTLRKSSSFSFDLSSGFPAGDSFSSTAAGGSSYLPAGAPPPVAGGYASSGTSSSTTGTTGTAGSTGSGAIRAAALTPANDRLAQVTAGAFLFGLLLVLAARELTSRPDVRRLLGLRLATAGVAAAAEGPRARGVGRFVKPRRGRAPSV